MSDLKPCPFCGSSADVIRCGCTWVVRCLSNDCAMQVENYGSGHKSEQVEVWNTRPIEDKQAEEIARLKKVKSVSDSSWRKLAKEIKQLKAELEQQAEEIARLKERISELNHGCDLCSKALADEADKNEQLKELLAEARLYIGDTACGKINKEYAKKLVYKIIKGETE